MAKNDFDIDFDFEEEYGFDPKSILGSDYKDDDLDLSDFDNIDLDMDMPVKKAAAPDYSDFDLDELDLDALMDDADVVPEEEEVLEVSGSDEEDFDDDFDDEDFDEGDDLLDFSRRATFFDVADAAPADQAPVQQTPDTYDENVYEEAAVEEEISQQWQQMRQEKDDDDDDDFDDIDDDDDEDEEGGKPRRRSTRERKPIKLTVPPVLLKLVALYIPPKNAFNQPVDPNNPRRRKKSKLQIFKEAYLPTILACVSLVLVLALCVGAIGNAIDRKRENDRIAKESSEAAASEAERVEQEAKSLMAEAARMAAGYDYNGAIQVLDSFTGNMADYPEMVAVKSEYVEAQSHMVEYRDPSMIPNLSFHVLIADTERAMADTQYGGKYNRNFVTTEEFSRILENLYANGYILVDFDSFTENTSGVNGFESISTKSIYLPEGKKPVMITETMVNYFTYMTDADEDGAYGDGFASRLVVTAGGEIKAEFMDANGQTMTGDYDLVPILETFIKAHPDFVYQDARATLAVCGYDGIFGYRINTAVISTQGQDYYNEQVAGATRVVEALRNKGYTLACYTFDNMDYGQKNANQISEDLKNWTTQITPVIGDVNVLVYAQASDIGDYTGNKFTVLHNAGFRYFVTDGESASTAVNSTYVKQARLMVTGENMAWKSSMFSDLFDCNAVLDLASRGGSVPH